MTALYGGLYGGVTLLNDIRFGYIVRMNTSPIDRRAIILGKMESSLFQTLLQLLVLVLISVFIGVEYNKRDFPNNSINTYSRHILYNNDRSFINLFHDF